MKYVVYIVLLLIITVCLLTSFTLIRNQAHLFTKPGVARRLKIYLTQNTAHTSMQPLFPELHSGVFQVGAQTLYSDVRASLVELGWSFSVIDEDKQAGLYRLHAVVVSPLFRFKDDVMILVHGQHCAHGVLQSVLDVSSGSRIGKGDIAANAGHIQRLLQKVRNKLEAQSHMAQTTSCH